MTNKKETELTVKNDAPESTISPGQEIQHIIQEDDPETQLVILERKAELAPRFSAAIYKLMLSQTFPGDWTIFGEGDKARACLGCAGAERIGKHFPIQFSNVKSRKEMFSDKYGTGYRYIVEGYATLYGAVCYAQGNYSTRDELLGVVNKEYRDPADINEGDIMTAAMSFFKSTAIKSLLGIRGLPLEEFNRLMKDIGKTTTKQVKFASGTQGGTSEDDVAKQQELAELCLQIANAGKEIAFKDKVGGLMLADIDSEDQRDGVAIAEESCIKASGFKGDKGWVQGKRPNDLAGKRLFYTLEKVKKFVEELDKQEEGT